MRFLDKREFSGRLEQKGKGGGGWGNKKEKKSERNTGGRKDGEETAATS